MTPPTTVASTQIAREISGFLKLWAPRILGDLDLRSVSVSEEKMSCDTTNLSSDAGDLSWSSSAPRGRKSASLKGKIVSRKLKRDRTRCSDASFIPTYVTRVSAPEAGTSPLRFTASSSIRMGKKKLIHLISSWLRWRDTRNGGNVSLTFVCYIKVFAYQIRRAESQESATEMETPIKFVGHWSFKTHLVLRIFFVLDTGANSEPHIYLFLDSSQF